MQLTKKLILAAAYAFSLQGSEPSVSIERFQTDRDKETVLAIINADSQSLAYESLGCAPGTTEKYITSTTYTTDVLRVDDKTVGFINYVDYNVTFLTFHIEREGLIHLMGINNEYRGKGYGKLLLNHALEELKKRNVPCMVLHVNKDNVNALNLYKKAGFLNIYPESMQEHLEQLILEKKYDIPTELLPKGNIIQQYPKTSLSFLATGLLIILALKTIHKK